MVNLLAANPLLLLFLVAALGHLLGRVRVAGFSFGAAAVLFVGLGFGALDPRLALPEFVYLFGLVLFVYTIGVASGPSFFAAFGKRGLRDNLLVLGFVVLAGGLAAAAHMLLRLPAPVTAGLFTGAFTNTPALSGVLEALKADGGGEAVLAQPVIGYSVAYPVGVIGVLVALWGTRRLWRIPPDEPPAPLIHRSVRVEHPEAAGDLGPVRLGRRLHGAHLAVATPNTPLSRGDVVSVIGHAPDVDAAAARLGEYSAEGLEAGRADHDMRRIFVSRSSVAGRTVGSLHLPERYGAVMTRVRRGDVDVLASEDTVLELGDRVRVVAPVERLNDVSKALGDALRPLSEVNVTTFGLGIALGLLLGLLPIPLPGGATFKLGFAGGPLIVGLLLGRLGRTGPLVWQLPQSANLTLRQVGLLLFLAGVGTRSGWSFATTFAGAQGLGVFVAGALMTCVVASSFLWVGHRLLHIPFAHLSGLLAGFQTQPAVLGFAAEQSRSDQPNVAYASVYPLATVAKIVVAQLLLGLG